MIIRFIIIINKNLFPDQEVDFGEGSKQLLSFFVGSFYKNGCSDRKRQPVF